MMDKLEVIVLKNLVYNQEYCRKVLPFIKPEYFETHEERVVFEEINKYVQEYQTQPPLNAVAIECERRTDLSKDGFQKILDLLKTFTEDKVDYEWLINTSEKWCKDRAVYLSLLESIKIADGKDKTKSRDAIPSILSEALGVCFDEHVGHDYIDDFETRYDFYHRKEEKIPFDLEFFNKITKGGLP